MNPATEGNSDVAELIGAAPPLHVLPARVFAPWHRPRKQYVRRYQWCESMRDLAIQVSREGGQFKYLTLPGQDMLDVRLLHDELCVPNDLKLQFLAFDSGAERGSAEEVATNSSLHAVMLLPLVDRDHSRLHADQIERLASNQSAAYSDLRSFGAFHAINIDLCDGAAKHAGAANNPNIFDVLNVLLEAQSRTQHDCVILLTTRIDSDQVHPQVRQSLDDLVFRNLAECDEFAQQMNEHIAHEQGGMTDEQFSRLSAEAQFTVGVLKWLCERAVRNRLEFKVASVMTYRQNPEAELDDLASIAVVVTPNRNPAPDAAGVAVAVECAADDQLECAYSGRFPRVLAKTVRVDVVMRQDEQKFAECTEETARLLEAASYDTSGYAAFAKDSLL